MSFKVAIIGRPNVGKSTLFNRLVGRKVAIVHDKPGVTRDRREGDAKLRDLCFKVIDTAGYEHSKEENIEKRMWDQTRVAIEEADICLFMYDTRAGLQPYDEHFAGILREYRKPVILLGNKCEGKELEDSIFEAYKLGLGEPIPFSAEHGLGVLDLYYAIKEYYIEEEPVQSENDEDDLGEEDIYKRPVKLAFVGRPNVGKSTLVNALLKQERMLTGPEAGITRDAITTDFEWEGKKIQLVDTAGLRKSARISDSLEKMSAANTKRAAFLAQVVVLVLDADAVLDKQDLTIARKVIDEGRALIIAVNKWDAATDKKETIDKLNYKLENSLTQVHGIPTVTISALKGKGLDKLMSAVFKIYERWNVRIPTSPLNRWFQDILDNHTPPMGKRNKRIKLRYITQVKSRPPSFAIFSSNPEGLPDSYTRYLVNSLRKTFDLDGIPIRINVRKGKNPYAD